MRPLLARRAPGGLGMRLTIGGVLIGVAVIAASFWVTLAVLDYFAAPPSPVAPGSTVTPSARVAPPESSPPAAAAVPSPPVPGPAPSWNEALYLAVNADVAAAVARKEFKSGREHYELA